MNKNYLSCDVLNNKTTINHFLLIMKTIIILLFTCVFISLAETGYTQNAKITLNKNNVILKEVLNEIESQTDYLFIYNNVVKTNKTVSVKTKNGTVRNVLNHVLKDSDIDFQMEGNHIILSFIEAKKKDEDIYISETIQQQRKTITGIIIDFKGEPIIGANIIEKETSNGTITDIDGKFSLNVDNNAVIRISYIGYLEQEIRTTGQTVYNISLIEDTKTLEELVVTALGIKKDEKALGYSVQKVDNKVFTTVKGENISTSLTGKVAGLMVRNTTEFFVSSSIKLRGSDALIVVNGVPTSNLSLDDIAADDIEDISVLKGATASALYGNRGSNGAIMITIKNKNQESNFSVQVNSNTMMSAGYLKIPESQKSYGTGVGNQPVYNGQFVWGPRLDMGTSAMQVDPATGLMKDMPLVSKGTNNLKNFLEESLVTNNNINVTQTTKNATIRGSFSHVHNKGEAPNTKANKYIFNLSGNINLSDKFTLDASWNYSKRETNNQPNYGYGRSG